MSQVHTDAVTLMQRFGWTLSLNLHVHVLFTDAVFLFKNNADLRFHRNNSPTSKGLTVQTIPAWEEDDNATDQLGRFGGFSPHDGVAVNTRRRKKLKRICQYI